MRTKRLLILVFILSLLVIPASANFTPRPKSDANYTTENLNTTWFDDLTNSMNGSSPDFTLFFISLSAPYTARMGSLFFVFVYLLPMAIIWIRQEKAVIPVGLGIIFGGLLIPILPPEWQGAAIIFIILTTVGILYSLFKERG